MWDTARRSGRGRSHGETSHILEVRIRQLAAKGQILCSQENYASAALHPAYSTTCSELSERWKTYDSTFQGIEISLNVLDMRRGTSHLAIQSQEGAARKALQMVKI